MAIKRCEKRGSGGRPVRERPCRRRSSFPFDKIIRSCRSSSYSVSVCRSSDQSPTSVVLVRESRRGLRVGGGGVSIARVLALGDGGSHRSVAAGPLSPRQGSFLSSAVVGSSFRRVKAISALRRRLPSPSLLGFRFSVCFILFRSLVVVLSCFWSRRRRGRSPTERVRLHARLWAAAVNGGG
ncbi:hypothetical protein F2Q68_00041915 [Brassica cretica]|uniref:Uncharacterized protein n=1 Tax=Brassica cretica TaxID=69181 RepID=A0A8S9MA47_BRACR|nr:hypothetical protein F2Q68_00041915 [Brassica cretica]